MSERVSIKKRLVKKGTMWSYYFEFNPAIENQKGEMVTTDTPGINSYVNPSTEEERIYNECNLKKIANLYDYWLELSLGSIILAFSVNELMMISLSTSLISVKIVEANT